MIVELGNLLSTVGATLDIQVRENLPDEDSEFEGISFISPVEVDARLTHKGEGKLSLNGSIKITCESKCARCLKPVRQDLSVGLDAEFHPVPVMIKGQTPEEIPEDAYTYSGRKVDIFQSVLEALLPEVPQRLLCSEDCRGLCPVCGQDLNTKSCSCAHKEADTKEKEKSPFDVLSKVKLN